jgi:SAM-dependent methyltransferase
MVNQPTCRSKGYAESFKDQSVVAAYRHRPPYAPQTFDLLGELVVDRPRTLLDAGTGPGDLARGLAHFCDRVDAVDFSPAMIEAARSLPGGDNPRIHWICAPIEEVNVSGPFALITAGDSLSWFNLDVVIPRFSNSLTGNGMLAVIERTANVGLREDDIIPRYSLNQEYVAWDPVNALQEAGLFDPRGHEVIGPISWTPTINEYIEWRHSQNGFSRERMRPERIAEFHAAVRARIAQQLDEGSVTMQDGRLQGRAFNTVIWGRPRVGRS